MKTNNKNKGFGALALILLVALAGYAGWYANKIKVPSENLAGTFQTPEVRALFETSLASKITSSATTFTLSSATDKDGTTLASSTYGFIMDEGLSTEEFILADCTSTACTNATRGLSVRTGTTTVAALQFEHRRGTSVKITDGPSLIFAVNVFKGRQNIENTLTYNSALSIASSSNQIPYASWVSSFANIASTSAQATLLGGANTWTGVNTFSAKPVFSIVPTSSQAPSAGSDVVNKTYADGLAIAGAPNSSLTVKGIVELATTAEINAGTATGGTGAALVVTPDQLLTSNYATPVGKVSTTSVQALATTTLSGIPQGKIVDVNIYISSTTENGLRIHFNDLLGGFGGAGYSSENSRPSSAANNLLSTNNNIGYILIPNLPAIGSTTEFIHFRLFNSTTTPKYVIGEMTSLGGPFGTSGGNINSYHRVFSGTWGTTTQAVNSISLSNEGCATLTCNYFGTSTYMSAYVIEP